MLHIIFAVQRSEPFDVLNLKGWRNFAQVQTMQILTTIG